ncbi:hypothetical protein NKH23_32330, partial [Mesorhizobium sp. M1328]|uniref:hypothetical protein n=1 Tax=Mesorhizobium sp. M1328 TaxID=2957082 RepID=UPI003335B8C7
LALQVASSATSTSTTPTIPASFAKEPDFFNGLLGMQNSSVSLYQTLHPGISYVTLHAYDGLYA